MNTSSNTQQPAPRARRHRRFYEKYRDLDIYENKLLNNFGADLISKIQLTTGSRYEAARRLKKKNRLSIVSILVLTFYAMFFSMLSTFDKVIGAKNKDLLALLSLFMSSFIAAFSVYEASKRYDVRSENFLRSARLIQGLRDRLTADYISGKLDFKLCKDYEKEYFHILDSYSDNHANIDFHLFRANIGEYNRLRKLYIKIVSYITIWWLFCFSTFSPLLIFVLYYIIANYLGEIFPNGN